MGSSGETTSGGVAFPSGRAFVPGASVKFPEGQVAAVDRVGLWVDGDALCLAMWPAELQAQYNRVYSDPAKVDALIALGDQPDWALCSNFHVAFRFAGPQQRWYPVRHLAGPLYVHQWISDFRAKHAGGRTREQLQDPIFRRWLVDRGYANDGEMPTLDEWLNGLSPGIKFHLRPSIEIVKVWPSKDALAPQHHDEFVEEARSSIDQILSALGEPQVKDLQPLPGVDGTAGTGSALVPKTLARGPVGVQESVCPSCHLIHAGECDW